ncbi:hypothetical protein AVEN_127530-1, partial [Araneus ventricosus]
TAHFQLPLNIRTTGIEACHTVRPIFRRCCRRNFSPPRAEAAYNSCLSARRRHWGNAVCPRTFPGAGADGNRRQKD